MKYASCIVVGIVFLFSIPVFAYSDREMAYAQYLARQGIIREQSQRADFRIDDTILRQEVIGIALKMQGVKLPEKYTCKKYFTDAVDNDWICRALEIAADRGIISRANTTARPGDAVTKSEALAILLKTGKISLSPPRRIPQSDGSIWSLHRDLKGEGFTQWQADMLDSLPSCEIINHGDSCEDGASTYRVFSAFQPQRLATRGEVFGFSASMVGFDSYQSLGNVEDDLELLLDNFLP